MDAKHKMPRSMALPMSFSDCYNCNQLTWFCNSRRAIINYELKKLILSNYFFPVTIYYKFNINYTQASYLAANRKVTKHENEAGKLTTGELCICAKRL